MNWSELLNAQSQIGLALIAVAVAVAMLVRPGDMRRWQRHDERYHYDDSSDCNVVDGFGIFSSADAHDD